MARHPNTAPIDPTDAFAQRLKSLEQQVAELQRSPRPWVTAWGYVTEATLTTDVTPITTTQDVLTVTFTAKAGRRYKITGQIPSIFQATGGNTTVVITDNTPTVIEQQFIAGRAANSNTAHEIWTLVTPSAGSVTYRLRVAANNAVQVDNSSTQITRLLVEDVGPA